LIYLICYILFCIPSNYCLDEYGLKASLVVGGVLTALGAWMRTLINQSFLFVLAAQILIGVGAPFIINSPAKVATEE
jgi:hypothetical protein